MMPRKPKKLVPWLRKTLDDEKFAKLGMRWEDQNSDKGTFWLPWYRQKNKVWKESMSSIILDYIKMQRGYKDGDDKKYVEWKARFRTALHKDPSITRIRKDKTKQRILYEINFQPLSPTRTSESSDSSSSSIIEYSDTTSSDVDSPNFEQDIAIARLTFEPVQDTVPDIIFEQDTDNENNCTDNSTTVLDEYNYTVNTTVVLDENNCIVNSTVDLLPLDPNTDFIMKDELMSIESELGAIHLGR